MGEKRYFVLLVLLVLAAMQSINTGAVGLGVSPAKLYYSNILKGGYAQNGLYLSTDTTANLSMFFEFNGAIKDWISVEYNENNISNITVSRSSPKQVKVIIQPAIDTPNGNYTGSVRVITDRITDPQTGIGSAVKAAFLINIYISVIGDEIKACSGGGISVVDAEIGFPITLSATIKNEGNVRANPQIFIDIWDKFQKEIVYSKILSSQSILPTETVRVSKEVIVDLKEEQYWAQIKIPECSMSGTLPLDILERGGISDKGELMRIESKVWALTGEILPITAIFKNTGPRTVAATFKGEILYGNKVVKIIDTDQLDAEPGEVIPLQTFFKAQNPGQYFIKGRVYYNNKLTPEKGSVINVNQSRKVINTPPQYFWYVLVILIILILGMLIMIKKKKHKVKRRHHYKRV